jgi:PPOX class probable F420-dependent enzyme
MTIPASHADLLERPLFGHLGTVKADGGPQVTPVWFHWDGELLSFTTSTLRAKCKHMMRNPNVAFSVLDPAQPYRYLEVRGTVERIDPDPGADFFFELADVYGLTTSHTGSGWWSDRRTRPSRGDLAPQTRSRVWLPAACLSGITHLADGSVHGRPGHPEDLGYLARGA